MTATHKKSLLLIIPLGVIVLALSTYSRAVHSDETLSKYLSDDSSCDAGVEKTVRGDSMYPLISEGEVVRAQFNYYKCSVIARGDVVLIEYPVLRESHLIKRILAIPGDTIHVRHEGNDDALGWQVVVNDSLIQNSENIPYSFSRERIAHIQNDAQGYGGVIPENYYLVLGDNPQGTLDSTISGLFSKETIVAKVLIGNT